MRHFILTLFCLCTLGLLASQSEARLQRIVVDGLEVIVAGSADEAIPELDIYLCIGQSNMAGRGSFTDATADMTGIYLLNGANQFIPSPARMSQYSNVASDSNDQYWIGPHYQFALDVHAATGRPIGMVVNARGGSGIESWVPSSTSTTQCYSKTIARLKAGLVGQKGISANRREGSMKTPIGDFGMITAFGIKPNPGTQLPYIDIDENIYGCDDEWYNQIIDIREHPHQCTGEHMIDYSPHYNYGFFFDFNREQVRGLGCSIFFHCMGPNPYTGSCIAVSEENMVTILQNIDMSARIIINYL